MSKNHIVDVMTDKGLTKSELARKAGVSTWTLWRAINDDPVIKDVTKVKIAKGLGVKIGEIYPEFKRKKVQK